MVKALSNDVKSEAESEFLVDADMWRRLPWSCWSVNRNGYVQCLGVKLHLVVAYLGGVEFKRDTVIDHKNRNRMDCRLENLRPCTAIQNGWNNERKHGHQLKNGKWKFTFSKSFPSYQEAEEEIRLGRFHHMSKNRTCFITETFDSYEEGYQWWKFQAGMHYGEFSPFANPYMTCDEIIKWAS